MATPSFTATPPQAETKYLICSSGGSANFSVDAPGASSYVWTPADGSIRVNGNTSPQQTGNTASITAYGNGRFTVKAKADACHIESPEISATIHVGLPTHNGISVDGNPGFGGTVCTGRGIGLQTSPQGGNASWAITSGNAANALLLDYGNGNAYFSSNRADCYGMTLTLNNACGSSTSGITVCANDCFAPYTVYPNPAEDFLTVEFGAVNRKEDLPERIELFREDSTQPVYSVNTREVYEKKMLEEGRKMVINVKQMARGIYYLHLTNKERSSNQVDIIRILLK